MSQHRQRRAPEMNQTNRSKLSGCNGFDIDRLIFNDVELGFRAAVRNQSGNGD